jgi:16S rRNA (guanine(966)-N(2))-methyltransferase RsmD
MLRVIAGTARGIRLDAPQGKRVRPTLDRVREAAFSILMPRLEGCRFADIFAGSGANGIEALSRGAAYCGFIDISRDSLDIVERNLGKTKLGTKAACYRFALPQGMAQLRGIEAPFDFVYADPPFDFSEYKALLAELARHGVLAPQGTAIIEHAKSHPMPETVGSLVLTRQCTYGTVTLSFFA